ncbi:hypothetical protein H4Q26_014486 [Puccinia striiformis f. sp. tritici PST-130]|nr:hypothetical protein H4Q26_014486 [Puccinia striiformis f. sp. tritici PST-130]
MTDRINAGDLDGIEATSRTYVRSTEPEGMVSDNLKKDLLKHLQLRFFPLLERQIGYLVRLLEPTNLLGEPLQTLERITAIQHELDRTLEQIQTFSQFVQNKLILTKIHLNTKLVTSTEKSSNSSDCAGCIWLSEELWMNIRREVIGYHASACEDIRSTMKWLDRSEVELIRILWPSEIEALDETLSDLLRLMNTPSEIRKNQQFHPIGWSKGRAPLRQVGFDLALSLSPTIKLSRLFL